MADIVKLKKKAADFEAKKQMDKALLAYREIIDAYEAGEEDSIDIPLYNRVGDMYQKSGNLPEAVMLWEKAVDQYSEGGFYNPAIALCNKILRHSPGRTVIYYKLGKISAEKGFKGDARENFLEYASRQQKAGNLDDAFKALKEFADLVPDQHDVRLMLADQLVKAERKDEAIEQLQLGYVQATAAAEEEACEQFVAKMKEIDPTVEPRSEKESAGSGAGGLVFLDVSAPGAAPKSPRPPPVDLKRVTSATKGLELLEPVPGVPAKAPRGTGRTPSSTPSLTPATPTPATPTPTVPTPTVPTPATPTPTVPTPIVEPVSPEPAVAEPAAPETPGLVFVSTDMGAGEAPPPRGSIIGLEVTSLGEESESPTVDLPMIDMDEPATEVPTDGAIIELEPAFGSAPTDAGQGLGEIPLLEMEPMIGDSSGPTEIPMLTDDAGSSGVELTMLDVGDATDGTGAPETADAAMSAEVVDAVPTEIAAVDEVAEVTEVTEVTEVAEVAEVAEVTEVTDLGAVSETADVAPPPRASTISPAIQSSTEIASSVEVLRARVEEAAEDWSLRRQLAEALLEAGQRDEGLSELEVAMGGYERDGDLDTAGSIAEEIVRLEPKSIRFHQKRVEFAFRANDRARLAEAYVELADALLADGQSSKARAVYQRVLDIRPDDLRAQAAIESIPEEKVEAPPTSRRSTLATPKSATPRSPTPAKPAVPAKGDADDDFVSLGDWLREDDEPKNTRMVVEEKEPTGDEQADFNDMLRAFKKGVSDNVEDEDHEAHYDLGVAYKEMGLLDEAIAEFQKALRGTEARVRTFESLGHCFVEKDQLPVASSILQRALAEPGVRDESLIGVLYLLGTIAERLGSFADAKKHFERVFAVDIQFRDIGDRLNAVEQHLK